MGVGKYAPHTTANNSAEAVVSINSSTYSSGIFYVRVCGSLLSKEHTYVIDS